MENLENTWENIEPLIFKLMHTNPYSDRTTQLIRGLKERKSIKIVFDMDDVLWDLNGTACQKINLNPSKIVTFHIWENPLLTNTEKEKLRSSYADSSVFRDIKWYCGAEGVQKLADMGHDVYINSNCGSQEIKDIKMEQIAGKFRLSEDHVLLNVIIPDSGHVKTIGNDVDIFVDDNPHNIAKSQAKLNIMPIKPWNANIYGLSVVKDMDNVAMFATLDSIMNFINGICRKR